MSHGKKVICKGTFSLEMFKVSLEVIVMVNAKEVLKKADQIFKKGGGMIPDKEEMIDGAHGFAISVGDKFYIILSQEELSVNTITHEVDHIRWFIMKAHGITNDSDDTTEVSANIAGYINEKVFKVLKGNGIEIKF